MVTTSHYTSCIYMSYKLERITCSEASLVPASKGGCVGNSKLTFYNATTNRFTTFATMLTSWYTRASTFCATHPHCHNTATDKCGTCGTRRNMCNKPPTNLLKNCITGLHMSNTHERYKTVQQLGNSNPQERDLLLHADMVQSVTTFGDNIYPSSWMGNLRIQWTIGYGMVCRVSTSMDTYNWLW